MPGFKDGYALIVGIANYPKVRRLPETILKDARDVHNLLRAPAHCGYPDANVRLLLDDKATADSIRDGIRWPAGAAGLGDTALVFFSGHGGRIETGPQAGNYLIPYDCDPANLGGTAIPGEELTGVLRDIQSQRLLIFFDSCYSGGTGETKGLGPEQTEFKSGLEESYYERLAQGTGRVIMASSRSDEKSLVLHGMTNRPFPHYLLQALPGDPPPPGDPYPNPDLHAVRHPAPPAGNQYPNPDIHAVGYTDPAAGNQYADPDIHAVGYTNPAAGNQYANPDIHAVGYTDLAAGNQYAGAYGHTIGTNADNSSVGDQYTRTNIHTVANAHTVADTYILANGDAYTNVYAVAVADSNGDGCTWPTCAVASDTS